MSNQNTFPTQYQNVSDTQLYGMFHSSVWFGNNEQPGLTLDQKVDALQEVVNREAEQNNTQPIRVTADDLNANAKVGDGVLLGQYDPTTNAITVDVNLIDSGVISVPHHVDEQGNVEKVDINIDASNLQSLSTVLHEQQHGVQNQSFNNPDIYNDKTHEHNVQANMQVYYGEPHDIYCMQVIEKEANQVAQERTQEIISSMEKSIGEEPGKQAYLDECMRESYEKALESAVEKYGPEVETTLQSVINDIYENNDIPQNASDTYIALYQDYYAQFLDSYQHQTQNVQETAAQTPTGTTAEQGTASVPSAVSAPTTESTPSAAVSDSVDKGAENSGYNDGVETSVSASGGPAAAADNAEPAGAVDDGPAAAPEAGDGTGESDDGNSGGSGPGDDDGPSL